MADFLCFEEFVFGISQNIGNVNRFALECRSPDRRAPSWRDRVRCVERLKFGRISVKRRAPIKIPITTKQKTEFGVTQAGSSFDERVKHGLEIKSRAANDLEHASGGSLLLQRLIALAREPRDICFLAGSKGTAPVSSFGRFAAPQRLAALRLCCLAACFVAPSHCLPRGSDKAS